MGAGFFFLGCSEEKQCGRMATAGTRQTRTKRRWYAVRAGRQVGVFESWDEARASVAGHPGAAYRRFDDPESARAYVEGGRGTLTAPGTNVPLRVYVTVAPRVGVGAFRYGVYWGPGDPRNEAKALPGARQSERRAGLYAMERAVRAVAADRWVGPVEVCSDCSVAMVWARDYMPTWKANGWVTARGTEPVDVDILRALARAIDRASADVRFAYRLRADRSESLDAARHLAAGKSAGGAAAPRMLATGAGA
ncbi:Ribonuclease H-like superfamily domain containing protein [Pandoravirus celtis]|uniref:Ribonuclease H n=2 Tax=Pandoravirus TaxID=2060084 RepID=A0A4D6EHQ5_9VIRU|nr:Ribonuclease H-like superfamily domain containing protein [Pandoravirus celtis]